MCEDEENINGHPSNRFTTERLSKASGRGTNGGRAHCKGWMISIPRLPKRVLAHPKLPYVGKSRSEAGPWRVVLGATLIVIYYH